MGHSLSVVRGQRAIDAKAKSQWRWFSSVRVVAGFGGRRRTGLTRWQARGANRDGGAGCWPVPCFRLTPCCYGSGWAGGRCLAEWIDRWFADEEAEDLAAQIPPVPIALRAACGLPSERLAAAGLLFHQGGDAAAEVIHDLVQMVPEGGGAEARHDAEIEADIDHGAAEGATAHLALEFLLCGHEEFGIASVGGLPGAPCGFGGGERLGW